MSDLIIHKHLPKNVLTHEQHLVQVSLEKDSQNMNANYPLRVVLVDSVGSVCPVQDAFEMDTKPHLRGGFCEFKIRFKKASKELIQRSHSIMADTWDGRRLKLRMVGMGNVRAETKTFQIFTKKLVVISEPETDFFNQDKKILQGNMSYCLESVVEIRDARGTTCTHISEEDCRIRTELWYEHTINDESAIPATSTNPDFNKTRKRKRTEPIHTIVGEKDCTVQQDCNITFCEGRSTIRFRINEVSRNHGGKSFSLRVIPLNEDIAPCFTRGICVKSKKLKRHHSKHDSRNVKPRRNGYCPTCPSRPRRPTMTFKQLRDRGLSLARGTLDPMVGKRDWINQAHTVLSIISQQPSGILSEKGETILVCRGCYIYFPESAKARHTQDCMIHQLLKNHKALTEVEEVKKEVMDHPPFAKYTSIPEDVMFRGF